LKQATARNIADGRATYDCYELADERVAQSSVDTTYNLRVRFVVRV